MKKKAILQLRGLDCATCKLPIEKAVRKMEGVIDINVNPINQKALVEYDSDKTDLEKIKGVVRKTGYAAMGMSGES